MKDQFTRIILFIIFLAISAFYVLFILKANIADSATTDKVYGVIRATNSGQWILLNSSGHKSYNIQSITQTDDYILVTFSPTFSYIHWAAITPDEALILTDHNVGSSVGYNTAKVYIAKDGVKVNPNTITSAGANVWFFVEGEY